MIGRFFGALVVGVIFGGLTYALIMLIVMLIVWLAGAEGLDGLGGVLLGFFIAVGASLGVGVAMTIVAYRALGERKPPGAGPNTSSQ